MSAAGRAHMGRVAQLPCCLCGAHGVQVHHILEGRVKGRRAGDWATIPLCPDCHTGPHNGIHGRQVMLRIRKTTELDLLCETLETLYGSTR